MNKKMKKLIALPYIYPVCPLNFNHTKMFVVGDVLSRYYRSNGFQVIFPVASHYTGNTAQSASDAFNKVFSKQAGEKDIATFRLYKNIYKTPDNILRNFVNADNLLNYYTQEILWELHSLNVSCDFKHNYSTSHKDFPVFVRSIIDQYQKHGLLIKNKNGDLALNYDDPAWKKQATELIESTEFEQPFHRHNILSARTHIRSDWELLRNSGFGVEYKDGLIIDPMFDSELFTIFDLYMIFKDEVNDSTRDPSRFFENLFSVLKSGETPTDPLTKLIVSNLPCDIFVCEEHLKNWVVKKFYVESLLLHSKYRTQKYHVLGMGALDGKRMSASRGHAILSKDLINQYGPLTTRLVILLSGGNLSKAYNYDRNLPEIARKMLDQITNYLTLLASARNHEIKTLINRSEVDIASDIEKIEYSIETGYFRQAAIDLLTTIPKKYPYPDKKSAEILLPFFSKYLEILLPGLFEDCVI